MGTDDLHRPMIKIINRHHIAHGLCRLFHPERTAAEHIDPKSSGKHIKTVRLFKIRNLLDLGIYFFFLSLHPVKRFIELLKQLLLWFLASQHGYQKQSAQRHRAVSFNTYDRIIGCNIMQHICTVFSHRAVRGHSDRNRTVLMFLQIYRKIGNLPALAGSGHQNIQRIFIHPFRLLKKLRRLHEPHLGISCRFQRFIHGHQRIKRTSHGCQDNLSCGLHETADLPDTFQFRPL